MKASATRGNKRFRVVEFTNPSGATAYRVTGWTVDGKRIRENFKTHAESVARKSELEIQSENLESAAKPLVTRLTVDQLAVAEKAFDRLAGKPMLDAVEYFLKNFSEPDRRISVADAFARFIAERKAANLRPLSIINLESKCAELLAIKGGDEVSSIGTDAIKPMIFKETRGPVAQNNHRRALHAFFEWARKQGYCADNPAAHIAVTKQDTKEPVVLSIKEAGKLLNAALTYKGGVVLPYVALATFAGLRPTELARLSWEAIDLKAKTVTITGKIAKMRSRRVVEMSDSLIEWLRPFAKAVPSLVGKNWRRDFDAVKAKAGFGTPTTKKPKLKPWTPDIMRHTAISYHLAKFQHEGKTALWAGNSPDVIQSDYKGLVAPSNVAKFWGISPKAKEQAGSANGKLVRVTFKNGPCDAGCNPMPLKRTK